MGVLFASFALADEDGEDGIDERDAARIVYFGSLEAGPSKTFVSYGSKEVVGAGELDASGFRLMNKVGVSREHGSRLRPHGRGYKVEVQSLLGYEWQSDTTALSLYAGTDFEAEYREVWYGYYGIARVGSRLQADLWTTPGNGTMAQVSAYVSTLDNRVWGRLALGHRIGSGLYLGPEVEFYRQTDYHKLRSGVHLTGLRLFGATWRLSAGWQDASGSDPGAYATLGMHWDADIAARLVGQLAAPLWSRSAFRP